MDDLISFSNSNHSPAAYRCDTSREDVVMWERFTTGVGVATLQHSKQPLLMPQASEAWVYGHILLHRMAGGDNPSCGFAAKPSQTKSTKSNAIFYRFPSLINIILEGVIDKVQNLRRNDS